MIIRRVQGNSMRPTIQPGAIVVARGRHPVMGDIVIAKQASNEVIKRVSSIKDGRYYLLGDNRSESVDSREFGAVKQSDILGVIMVTLPLTTNAPKPRTKYAVTFGIVAALILAFFAVIQMFRIDTFVPELDYALPLGRTTAAVVGVTLLISEVFAIPVMLRLKLSPLARFLSGILAALAPLMWLCIAILNYGYSNSIGQFGEYYPVTSGVIPIALNSLWLLFNVWVLWLLGFKQPKLMRKFKNTKT